MSKAKYDTRSVYGVTVLLSYETPVAVRLTGGIGLKTEEYFSRTTTKHINFFLRDYKNVITVPKEVIRALWRATMYEEL